MIKKIFKILDMHCTACAMNIDGELEDTEGVKQSNTNYAKAQTEVEFDEEKLNEEKIIKIIKIAGYNATLAN
jgi:copper chaperone CopZ